MTNEPAYYVGTHHWSFRVGQAAEITGVVICTPNPQLEPRPCFVVKYPDGEVDYCPISEMGYAYKIVPKSQIT